MARDDPAGARLRRCGPGIRLVLDDGTRVNVLREERVAALAELVDRLARPGGPCWLIIEGNRHGSFAAGADLRQIGSLSPLAARRLARTGRDLLDRLASLPCPVGCLVDGHAVGGGFDLALAGDVLAATDRSWFAHPGLERGFFTGWGGTSRVPLAGRRRTGHDALLAARRLRADAAERAGMLAVRAPDRDRARRRLRRLLDRLARWPAPALDAWRRLRWGTPSGPLLETLWRLARVDTPEPRC
ncbi:MAG: enoyl-CoA hydratase-related protein [Acidobacteriota bacterium]